MDVPAERVLHDAAEDRGGHDRDDGRPHVADETAARATCADAAVPVAAARSVINERHELSERDAEPEREEHACGPLNAATAIGAPTRRRPTIAAQPIERRDHVVACVTRLLRELEHRGADQRQAETGD